MRLADFDYELPPERIAQAPLAERDASRLYVLPRRGLAIDDARHLAVGDLPELLPRGALLVINDTRVIAARLRARKQSGGRVELFLLERRVREIESGRADGTGRWRETWRCLGGSSKGLRAGQAVAIDGALDVEAHIESVAGAEVTAVFRGLRPGDMYDVLDEVGEVPLPPYIKRPAGPSASDRERYQTVYAQRPGAAAAPTAGLHLSTALLDRLAARGIERAAVTLHVGLGTFSPLRLGDDEPIESVTELHAERYEIPEATASAIRAAREQGRPVIAVGTTVVRCLESAARPAAVPASSGVDPAPPSVEVTAGEGVSRLFIRPPADDSPFPFRVVDGLLTNFHLPRSTLLMLVSAFAGRARILAAYRDAVARDYRFFSYGDAMLLT